MLIKWLSVVLLVSLSGCYSSSPKQAIIVVEKSSHLEKYKSIPLKNLKKAKGNGVIKYSTHHKQLSNN